VVASGRRVTISSRASSRNYVVAISTVNTAQSRSEAKRRGVSRALEALSGALNWPGQSEGGMMAVDPVVHVSRRRGSGVPRTRSLAGRAHAPTGLICFFVVFALYGWLAWRGWEQHHSFGPLNWYTSILWTLPVLSSSLGLVGMLCTAPRGCVSASVQEPPLVSDLLVVLVPTLPGRTPWWPWSASC